jgi:hypothetical protein
MILRLFFRSSWQREYFSALLHNTVSPTVLRAGEKTNVISPRPKWNWTEESFPDRISNPSRENYGKL